MFHAVATNVILAILAVYFSTQKYVKLQKTYEDFKHARGYEISQKKRQCLEG